MNKFGYKLKGLALASAIAAGAFSLTACGTKDMPAEEPTGGKYETVIYYIEGKYYSFDIDDMSLDNVSGDSVAITTDGYQISKHRTFLDITDPEGNTSIYTDWAFIDPECLEHMESHEIPNPFEDIDLE